jgi:hypothetical protein
MRAIDHKTGIWSLSLGQIEATVAAHLGPGRPARNTPLLQPSNFDVLSEAHRRVEHDQNRPIL